MAKWKIYINCGYADEFKKLNDLTFSTKKDAHDWAKSNGYPQRCVVTELTWMKLKK